MCRYLCKLYPYEVEYLYLICFSRYVSYMIRMIIVENMHMYCKHKEYAQKSPVSRHSVSMVTKWYQCQY